VRVALDLQPACRERTGVGQYAWYLARHLPFLSPSDSFVGLAFGRCGGGLGLPESPNFRLVRRGLVPARGISLLWRTAGWPPADLFTGPVDLFHFPSFVARPLRNAAAVATIHDLAYARLPDCAEPKNAAFLNAEVPRTLARIRMALVDSEFTKRELAEVYGYPAERVRVTHLGVDGRFSRRPPDEIEAARRRHGLPQEFILCVATIEPRKNLGTLLEAYRLLREGGGEVPPLVLVGGDGWRNETERIERTIAAPGLAGAVRRIRYLGHDELPAVYSAARLFVFPALYEGFGLPPLESMACGVPVVCSNAASLPEVAGDAAVLVPPRDAAATAAAIRRLLDDEGERRELVARGLLRAKRFTWTATVRATLAAYRDALSSSPPG